MLVPFRPRTLNLGPTLLFPSNASVMVVSVQFVEVGLQATFLATLLSPTSDVVREGTTTLQIVIPPPVCPLPIVCFVLTGLPELKEIIVPKLGQAPTRLSAAWCELLISLVIGTWWAILRTLGQRLPRHPISKLVYKPRRGMAKSFMQTIQLFPFFTCPVTRLIHLVVNPLPLTTLTL